MQKIIIKTEKQTQEFASKLAKSLKGGEIIALEGDLGAGKTTLTQFLGHSLGIKQHITSPTFVLMKVYQLSPKPKAHGPQQFVHVDCYRLDDPQELFYLGLEEYLNDPQTVVCIEWADKVEKYLHGFTHLTWLKILVKNNQRIINLQ